MPTTAASYVARELPPEEWARLDGLGLAQQLPDPSTATLLVVEHEGRIVASWVAMTVVHLEGCAIDPAHQKSPGVVRALIQGMNDLLGSRGIPQVLTVTQTADVAQLTAKLGGQPLGQLWLLTVPLGDL